MGGHSELSTHSGAKGSSTSGTIFRHCICGLPVYPMGQVQEDSWNLDLQMAFAPQGSTLQESLQVPSTHFSGSPHSLSEVQNGEGVTLGLQSPFGPMNESSGHMQMTVLIGELFITLQVCVRWHGLFTRQGFWQLLSIQARPWLQSSSTLHSSTTGS